MFIEIVDSLRCPNEHADSWLVASCDAMDHRDILTGRLGCPVCKAEYPIRDGAVWFDGLPLASFPTDDASEEEAMRIAAFLDLTDARGFAILEGRWTAHAALVSAIVATPLVLFNPPVAIPAQPGISVVYGGGRPPFAVESARAIALDRMDASALVNVLRPGGRALGAVSVDLPPDLVEIVRDGSVWVAEKKAAVVRVEITGRSRMP